MVTRNVAGANRRRPKSSPVPDRFPAESRPGEFRAQAAAGVQRRSVVLAARYLAVRAEGAVAEQPGSVDEREEAAGWIGEEGRIG